MLVIIRKDDYYKANLAQVPAIGDELNLSVEPPKVNPTGNEPEDRKLNLQLARVNLLSAGRYQVTGGDRHLEWDHGYHPQIFIKRIGDIPIGEPVVRIEVLVPELIIERARGVRVEHDELSLQPAEV